MTKEPDTKLMVHPVIHMYHINYMEGKPPSLDCCQEGFLISSPHIKIYIKGREPQCTCKISSNLALYHHLNQKRTHLFIQVILTTLKTSVKCLIMNRCSENFVMVFSAKMIVYLLQNYKS